MLPLSCYMKNLQYYLFHLNCGPQIYQIWIQLITACGSIACKRRTTKYASLIWTNWNSDWERSGPTGSCRHCGSHLSVVSLIAPDQWWHVLYTVSCNISHMLWSTGFKSGEFGRHNWNGINSRVSFCNNSTVACARWAFQVSQGSVETLFRWSGKRLGLHHFAENLFRKRCTKFHKKNRPIFIGDTTKKHYGSFFWTQCIYYLLYFGLSREIARPIRWRTEWQVNGRT